MKNTWLIQRLEEPHNNSDSQMNKAVNAFAFGGGYKNGGLSDEAMELISPLFSFDYMGAAEFEFGAVPETLQQLGIWASNNELTTFEVDIPLKDVFVPEHHDKTLDYKNYTPSDPATIYCLANQAMVDEIKERIHYWFATDPFTKDGPSFKASPYFYQSFYPYENAYRRLIGWLELDNSFIFFSDKTSFDGICKLFGVEHGNN